MPMYDFRCRECDTRFEELVRGSSDQENVRCPSCGSAEVQRQVSAAALMGGASGGSGRSSSAPSRPSCTGFT